MHKIKPKTRKKTKLSNFMALNRKKEEILSFFKKEKKERKM